MNMIIVTTILTVLYALGWHNQPARDKESFVPKGIHGKKPEGKD